MKALWIALTLLTSLLMGCAEEEDTAAGGGSSTLSYKVGGTVSGLDGAITLQNNGTDDIIIGQNGSFTFPTGIVGGGSHSVTVKRHPASQTCTVNNGSGTVNGTITSVRVICSNTSFVLSASVSGLPAGGLLTLQNNGTDNLTFGPWDNTTQSFSDNISAGAAYSVSVLSQPNPYTCSISNSRGIMVDNTTTSVVCSVRTYSVSGVVSVSSESEGLDNASQLALVLNGKSPDLLLDNGSFLFDSVVAEGGGYQLGINAPDNHTCTATNGMSTAVTADVSDVKVSCWKSDVFSSVQNATQPDITSSGNALAISWLEEDNASGWFIGTRQKTTSSLWKTYDNVSVSQDATNLKVVQGSAFLTIYWTDNGSLSRNYNFGGNTRWTSDPGFATGVATFDVASDGTVSNSLLVNNGQKNLFYIESSIGGDFSVDESDNVTSISHVLNEKKYGAWVNGGWIYVNDEIDALLRSPINRSAMHFVCTTDNLTMATRDNVSSCPLDQLTQTGLDNGTFEYSWIGDKLYSDNRSRLAYTCNQNGSSLSCDLNPDYDWLAVSSSFNCTVEVDNLSCDFDNATGLLDNATGLLDNATGLLDNATGLLDNATRIRFENGDLVWAKGYDNVSEEWVYLGAYDPSDVIPELGFDVVVERRLKFDNTTTVRNADNVTLAILPQVNADNSTSNYLVAAWQELGGPDNLTWQLRVAYLNRSLESVTYLDPAYQSDWYFIDGDDAQLGLASVVPWNEGMLDEDGNENSIQPELIVFQGELYLAWIQQRGNGRLRMAKLSGTLAQPEWQLVDGYGQYGMSSHGLNFSETGEAATPRMAIYNNALYVVWAESDGSSSKIRAMANRF
jgi:hypothetical protein